MTILPNAVYRFNAISIELPMTFFHRTRTKNFTIHMETQKTLNCQSSLEKNGAGGISLPNLRLYCKAAVIKTVWYRHKKRNTDQWNKIENPEIKLCNYAYLIFDKGGKHIQWSKDSFFNKWCWENWTAACKIMKLGKFQTPYTKKSSKWIKYLNVRPETVKLLEENIGRTLNDITQKDPL